MASYAFIQKDGSGNEEKRLCATDASAPVRLLSGLTKAPSAVIVGDVLKPGNFTVRVDAIDVS